MIDPYEDYEHNSFYEENYGQAPNKADIDRRGRGVGVRNAKSMVGGKAEGEVWLFVDGETGDWRS